MNRLKRMFKRLSVCGLLLLLSGCVVSETYLVHRCTTLFSKTKCVNVALEVDNDALVRDEPVSL